MPAFVSGEFGCCSPFFDYILVPVDQQWYMELRSHLSILSLLSLFLYDWLTKQLLAEWTYLHESCTIRAFWLRWLASWDANYWSSSLHFCRWSDSIAGRLPNVEE